MITRVLSSRLEAAARQMPAVAVLGPRQSGKTTLCRAVFPEHAYVSLEAHDVREYDTLDRWIPANPGPRIGSCDVAGGLRRDVRAA